MKLCYIAHPISGDIEANLADLRRIIRHINVNYPSVVPFAPYMADVLSMDDNIPEERERGIKNDIAILRSGVVNELWLTGDKISKGMATEVQREIELGIKVVDKIGEL